jgi:hypothetical protein
MQASYFELAALRELQRDSGPATDEYKLHARWALLLDQLGIVVTDEYEKLVAKNLVSGLFDRSAVDAVVERYKTEEELALAQTRVKSFLELQWKPDLSEEEVVAEAEKLVRDTVYIDPYTLTHLHDFLLGLSGGLPVAKRMESAWIAQLKTRAADPTARSEQFVLENHFGRPLLSSIVVAFREARSLVEKPRTLFDVVDHLVNNNGWDLSHETVMSAATTEEFILTIYGLTGHKLRSFLLKNIDLYLNRSTFEARFGSSGIRFVEACKKIRADRSGTRWAKLMDDVLNECAIAPTDR